MSLSRFAADSKHVHDLWRARVGRLPLANQQTMTRILAANSLDLVETAVRVVAERGFRRTDNRWRLFLAYFGETP